MYRTLWRALPGPTWLKVIWALLLIVLVVAVCFQWVFPWAEQLLPFNDNSVTTE